MKIIVHRGVGCGNTIVGIMLALFHRPTLPVQNRWCEVDVLWTGTEWILCHDFETMWLNRPSRLRNLVDALQTIKGNIPTDALLLIDTKWDYIHNHTHDLERAMSELYRIVATIPVQVWIQFGHSLLDVGRKTFRGYRVGCVMSHPMPIQPSSVDFLTVDLSAFSKEDLRKYDKTFVIGYTCTRPENVIKYLHLDTLVNALVCDVY